jgi:hypothetical protein
MRGGVCECVCVGGGSHVLRYVYAIDRFSLYKMRTLKIFALPCLALHAQRVFRDYLSNNAAVAYPSVRVCPSVTRPCLSDVALKVARQESFFTCISFLEYTLVCVAYLLSMF